MDKLVSVIVPTYNRASMIKRAVESIIKQDYTHLEIIVVDDASSDNTENVIKSIQDPRIVYIKRSENKGAGSARNTAIEKARGEYLAFLDSDDEFMSGKLREEIGVFEEQSFRPGLVFSNYWEVGEKKKLNRPRRIPSGYVSVGEIFPASVYCPPSTWLIQRNLADKIGFFDKKLWTMEDIDYFARAVRECPAYFINKPLVTKYVHTCKKGSVPSHYAEQTGERILGKWVKEMRRDKSFLIKFYCTMGKDMMRIKKKDKALKYLRRAVQTDPVNFKVLWKLGKAYFSS